MPKYKIYAILALLIMTVAFTIPTLGFFKVQSRIVSGQVSSVSQLPAYSALALMTRIFDILSAFWIKALVDDNPDVGLIL